MGMNDRIKDAEKDKLEYMAYFKRQSEFIENPKPLNIITPCENSLIIATPAYEKYKTQEHNIILLGKSERELIATKTILKPHCVVAFDKNCEGFKNVGLEQLDYILFKQTQCSPPIGEFEYDKIKYSIFTVFDILTYIKNKDIKDFKSKLTINLGD